MASLPSVVISLKSMGIKVMESQGHCDIPDDRRPSTSSCDLADCGDPREPRSGR